MIEALRDLAMTWYLWMASLTAGVTPAVQGLDARVGVPLVSALLLGVLGAAAPCQITQSIGMVALLGQPNPGAPRWRAALAYVSGKALVYSALGVIAVALGAGLNEIAIPVFVVVRKAFGPLLIVVGLLMIGVLRWRWAPGTRLASRLRAAARERARHAPFLFGVAFGFSFCPTLFGIFFGLLIPLALSRPDGLLYPAVFGLGTALPLLALLAIVASGGESLTRSARRVGRGQRLVAVLSGVLLVLLGLNDTVVYWLL